MVTVSNNHCRKTPIFFFDEKPDLILDAIDTVTAKLFLAQTCKEKNIPLISCLGTGNRVDPSSCAGEIFPKHPAADVRLPA